MRWLAPGTLAALCAACASCSSGAPPTPAPPPRADAALVVVVPPDASLWELSDESRAEFERGLGLLNEGHRSEARAAFERAHRMTPLSPAPLRWLANIARLDGRNADCVELATTALRLAPESVHRLWIRNERELCERALKE